MGNNFTKGERVSPLGSIEELEQWWKLNPNSILTIG